MNKQPLLSIVVPVYNTYKDYLIECLESIKSIEDNNFEVVIIDDGSNQETKDILNSYSNIFTIFSQENKGIVSARCAGIAKAKGQYIFFVDSDDVITSDAIAVLTKIINSYAPDIISQNNYRFKDSINNVYNSDSYLKPGIVSKEEVLKQLCMLHISSIVNKICRKELYNGVFDSLDSSIINGDDLQFSTNVILKANKIYHTDAIFYYYRINEIYREYYGENTINDINYLIPTYNILFVENKKYDYLKPIYKNAAVKSVIYTGFKLGNKNTSYKEKTKMLDKLNAQPIIKILLNTNEKIPFISSFLFGLLTKKIYPIYVLLGYIYKKVFGLDKSTNQ